MHRGRSLAARSPSPCSHTADKANSFGCGKSQQDPCSKGWSSARCWVTGSQDPSLCSSRKPLTSPGSNCAGVAGTPKPQADQNQMMEIRAPYKQVSARPEEPRRTLSLPAGNSAPSSRLPSRKAELHTAPARHPRGGPGREGPACRGSAELVLGLEGAASRPLLPGAAADSRLPLRDRDRDSDRDHGRGPGPAPPGPHGRWPLGLSHASRPAL